MKGKMFLVVVGFWESELNNVFIKGSTNSEGFHDKLD